MDVLHHDLETVEATCFWDLDFTAETLDEVLVDNAVRGSEEGKDVGDEVSFIIVESVVPVVRSLERSISSAVQKDASAFLYICHI